MGALAARLYRYRITVTALGFFVVLLGGGFTLGLLGVDPVLGGDIAAGFAYLWLGLALFVGLVSEAISFGRAYRRG